jgi:hypothetical protein
MWGPRSSPNIDIRHSRQRSRLPVESTATGERRASREFKADVSG